MDESTNRSGSGVESTIGRFPLLPHVVAYDEAPPMRVLVVGKDG